MVLEMTESPRTAPLSTDPVRYLFNELLQQHKQKRDEQGLTAPTCFISYAWEGEKAALAAQQRFLSQLRDDLHALGCKVFLDIKNMYGDLDTRMREGIEESDHIILIGTPTLQQRLEMKVTGYDVVLVSEDSNGVFPESSLAALYKKHGESPIILHNTTDNTLRAYGNTDGTEVGCRTLKTSVLSGLTFPAVGQAPRVYKKQQMESAMGAEATQALYAELTTQEAHTRYTNVRFEWEAIKKKIQNKPDTLIPILYKGNFDEAFPASVTKKMVYFFNKPEHYYAQLAGFEEPIGMIPAILYGKNLDTPEAQHYKAQYTYFQAQATRTQPALAKLKAAYQEKQTITGMFGAPFPLDGGYINVQMLYRSQQAIDTADTTKSFQDARLSSYEDLLGKKIPVAIPDLFVPATQLLGQAEALSTEAKVKEAPNFLLIHGRAGIGKTTFVDYVAREWSLPTQEGRTPLWPQFEWLFVMRMRDLSNHEYQGKTLSLQEWIYLAHFATNTSATGQHEFNQYVWPTLAHAIRDKKLLVILDGYDETPHANPSKDAISELIEREIPCIITSRPYGTSDLQRHPHRKLEVVGFVDENVKKYIHLYFGQSREVQATQLIQALQKNIPLWGSAHIPVTLNLMCGVLESKAENSAQLFAFLDDVSNFSKLYMEMEWKLLERAYEKTHPAGWTQLQKNKHTLSLPETDYRQQLRFAVGQTYQRHRNILAFIAFHAFHANKLLIEPSLVKAALEAEGSVNPNEQTQWIEQLLQIGLFREVLETDKQGKTGIKGYEFLHLTFQEYYAALYSPIIEMLKQIKLDPRYQIVLWFMAGHLKDQPELLKQYIKALQTEAVDIIGGHDLALLVRCSEETYPELQALNALKPIQNKIRAAIRGLWRDWVQGTISKDSIPPNWLVLLRISTHWLEDNTMKLLSGLAKSDTASKSLTEFLDWLQLPRLEVMEQVAKLLADRRSDVFAAGTTLVGKLGEKAASPAILTALVQAFGDKDRNVRNAAYKAVKVLSEKVTSPEILTTLLIQALGDKEGYVRHAAYKMFAALGDKAASPEIRTALLVQALGDKDTDVRHAACQAVATLGDKAVSPEILTALVPVLRYEGSYLHQQAWNAVKALGEKAANPEVLTILVQALGDKEKDVRQEACDAVAALGEKVASPEILTALVQALGDKNHNVRQGACKAVAALGDKAATPEILKILTALVQTFGDKENYVRQEAWQAVAALGDKAASPELLTALVQALGEKDKYGNFVRKAACQAVKALSEKVANPEILTALVVQAFGDKNRDVRQGACEAVAALGENAAIAEIRTALVQAVGDEDREVRKAAWQAVKALGEKAASPEIRAALVQALGDKEKDVRQGACEAVAALGEKAISPEIRVALVQALGDEDTNVRYAACQAVKALSEKVVSPEIRAALVQALGDEGREVRQRACQVVAALGERVASPEIRAALVQALGDKDKNVRQGACEAVAALSDKAASSEIRTALVQALEDEDKDVRQRACQAVAALGDKAASPEIRTALVQALGDKDKNVRQGACEAVAALGDKAASSELRTALVQALGDKDGGIRQRTCQAIATLGEKVASPEILTALLVQALGDEPLYIREAAYNAIKNLGIKANIREILLAFIPKLGNGEPEEKIRVLALNYVKRYAAQFLNPLVVTSLLSYFEGEDREARRAAADILRECECSLLEAYFKNYFEQSTTFEELVIVVILAYFSGRTVLDVRWDGKAQTYQLVGFVDKEPFTFKLTPAQAQWYVYRGKEWISRLKAHEYNGLFEDLEADIAWPLPSEDALLIKLHSHTVQTVSVELDKKKAQIISITSQQTNPANHSAFVPPTATPAPFPAPITAQVEKNPEPLKIDDKLQSPAEEQLQRRCCIIS